MVKAWLEKTVREPDPTEGHRWLCLVSQWTRSVTLWFGSPNPGWKNKTKPKKQPRTLLCFCFFKGIGLLPPALFFLPWTRVYNSSWLLDRWSRWDVQEIHSRASCLDLVGEAQGLCLPSSILTGSTFHVSWKHFIRKGEKKKKSQTTTKGKRKRATSEHSPAPVRQIIVFLPWNKCKGTGQAKHSVLMVSHCSTSQPHPLPFSV